MVYIPVPIRTEIKSSGDIILLSLPALGGYIVTLADPNTPDEKYVFRIAVVEESRRVK